MRVRKPDVFVVEAAVLVEYGIALIVYAAAAGAIIVDARVAALHREARYAAMESAALVVPTGTFLTSTQYSKVICRQGHFLIKKLKNNATSNHRVNRVAVASDCIVEEDLDVLWIEVGQLLMNNFLPLLFDFGVLFVVNTLG